MLTFYNEHHALYPGSGQEALARVLAELERRGLGRIVTPHAPPAPWSMPGRRREDRFCVYGRAGQPCPRCGARIRQTELAGRALFFCAKCQGRARPRPTRQVASSS